jgi:hypothetical protein
MTNNYNEEARPVRKIPTREQVAAARRQAAVEAGRYSRQVTIISVQVQDFIPKKMRKKF